MPLNAGEIVAGKYRVEKLLGEGGMGSVFVATNTVLQRQVALKVMSEKFTTIPAAVERFHREAVAASKVSHTGIVQVFDAGNHEGSPWIAMELLEGESLGERLERGPMRLDEVMKMALGTLSALAEVHESGIVHRDLKPDNIFLTADKKLGFVPKILDFGVAKDMSDGALSKLTATGAVVGTAHYLSPEQAKGLPDIDARADVYAMGVVLFECLSGKMPYEADTITQLIAKMFTEPPRLLAHIAPSVPSPIADVVAACLQQDREHRYHSARGMLEALETADAVIHGRAGPHMMGTQPGPPGVAPQSPAALGMAGTAMGHMPGGQVPPAPGFASNPGTATPGAYSQPGHAQPGLQPGSHHPSQPGMQGHIPLTAAGSPQPPGMPQPGYMAPGSVPGVGPVGSMVGTPIAHAAPPKSGAGKGVMLAFVAALFLLGAVATGGAVWFLGQGGDASDAVASADVSNPAHAPPITDTRLDPPAPVEPPTEIDPATPTDPTETATTETATTETATTETATTETATTETATTETATTETATTSARRRRRRRRLTEQAAEREPPPPPVASPTRQPIPTPAPVRRPPPRPRAGLTQHQVQGVINGSMGRLENRCYQRRLRRVPNLRGVVTIGWVVRPDGRADNVAILHNGTGDEWLARCTRQIVSRMRFPRAANGLATPVRRPFTFSAQ